MAGILRSLDYAVRSRGRSAPAADDERFVRLAGLFRSAVPDAVLGAYRCGAALPDTAHDKAREAALLRLFLLEKAAYEVAYELDNRPDWLGIALGGLAHLVEHLGPDRAA